MAGGNWMDDRERQMRERDGRGMRDVRREDGEDRSWNDRSDAYGAKRSGPDRDRVFGEGESGASYGGPRPSGIRGGPSRGWQDRHYGGVSPAMYDRGPRFGSEDYTRQDYATGGRFYGDDSAGRIYREEYGQGGVEYGDVPRGYDAGYSPTRARYHAEGYGRPGYGGGEREGRTERFEGAGRGAGEFLHRAGERVAAWFGAGSESRIHDPDFQGSSARGKGPQGYKRSDERISDDAHERLTDDHWLDASNINLSVSAGEVTLSGTVETREAKHRAERIVEDISGVNHVQNNLRLDRGSFLTRPASGYGDSALDAEMRSDDPVANGTGGAGAGQSTAGRKN
ncbi:BON domain-containing protein [Phenylobacterium sp.]|uniref:BON domain-containing protein n=1 Tax=Phenylobacterium sp. TaxID=1871053 RepID=UPI0035671A5C